MDKEDSIYPGIIKELPDAEIPFKGVTGKLLQGPEQQLVFMEIEPIGDVPPHSHSAQWGMVVEGQMQLTIGGVVKTYRKGDSYFIPEGVEHSASFATKAHVIDFFDDKDRFTVKSRL